MATDAFQQFGFGSGDDNVSSGKFDKFKPQEGQTYRLSFSWWPEVDGKPNLSEGMSPQFVGGPTHYINGVGSVLAKGPELVRLAGGPAKVKVATVVVIWPTNAKGELSKQRFAEGDYDVKPWLFSAAQYENLRRRHGEWPFTDYDIQVTCTDTQFQKIDVQPSRDSMLKKLMSAESENAKKFSKDIFEKTRLIALSIKGMIGQDLSIEKIKEKMGGGGGGASGPVSAESSAQVDEMLDDLLK